MFHSATLESRREGTKFNFKNFQTKRHFLHSAYAQTERPVWPDLAKFRHFGKSLEIFGKFLTAYFLFGKMLSILWQICDIIGLIFIAANGQKYWKII